MCGFSVVLRDDRSHMGGVMIFSPWYLLVAYIWDIVGLRLFLGVYTKLHIWNSLFVVLLVVIVLNVGCWVLIPICTLFHCNFIVVNSFGPTT